MSLTLEQVLDNIQEAFVEVDGDLRLLRMNAQAEILLRRDRSAALGCTLEEVIPDATRSQHWPALVALIRAGRSETISVFYPGQYRWHDVTVIPVEPSGAALLLRDVTDRQWIIRREAERTYLQGVFQDVPVAISLVRGQRLQVEYMNTLAHQLIGSRNVIGLPLRDALPELEQAELFDVVERVYATGEPYQARGVYVRFDRDGDGELEDGFFDVSYHSVKDFDGKPSGVLCISIEVTDRHRQTGTGGSAGPS